MLFGRTTVTNYRFAVFGLPLILRVFMQESLKRRSLKKEEKGTKAPWVLYYTVQCEQCSTCRNDNNNYYYYYDAL